MKKQANSPTQRVDPEELRDIIEILAVKLNRAIPQAELDIEEELTEAIKRAKANKVRRKPKRKPIDLEERALESRKKNVEIDLIMAQAAQLRKPWWKREPLALLTLIVTSLGTLGASAKSAPEPIPIVITVQQRGTNAVNNPLYLQQYCKPLPRSQYLRLEINKILQNGSVSLKKHDDSEVVKTRIVQSLEDLKKREIAKMSEMKSPTLLFSRAVEKRDIQNLDHLIEFFRSVEFEQSITLNA